MKKLKILIPALGVLGISIAASVTSTITWFVANRTADRTAGNIYAVNTDGDLKTKITANAVYDTSLVGDTETADGSASSSATGVTFDSALRDTSIDIASVANTNKPQAFESFYHPADGSFSYAPVTTSADSKDETMSLTGDEVYYYAKFSIEFLTSNTRNQDYLLFMNLQTAGSAITIATGNDATGNDTAKVVSALRFAFVNTVSGNAGKTFIWAPAYDTTYDKDGSTTGTKNAAIDADSGLAYVKATSDGAQTPTYSYDTVGMYPNTKAVKNTGTTALHYDNEVSKTTAAAYTLASEGYMGVLNGGTTDVTAKYDVYVWFEGEDILCNSKILATVSKKISANMKFYCVKAAA